MFGCDAENELESLLDTMVPGDRAVMIRRLRIIAAHFDATMVAGIESMIADRNPELKARAWDVARAVIQTARGYGDWS
jgi:hypothetical protein